MSELNYQVNKDETEESFEPIPAGEYLAVIESSDYIDNKKGTGKMLKLTYQVIEGNLKGRKLFNNLNLENESKQAEQIARKSLNSIGLAVGVTDIKDSSLLHDIPFKIKVTVKDGGEQYGLQNNIVKHSAIEGAEVPSKTTEQSAKTVTADEVPKGGKKTHPWEKDKK